MNTTQKIDMYFEVQEELAKIGNRKQEVIDMAITPDMKARIQEFTDSIITKDVRQKLADIDIEFEGYSNIANANIAQLKAEITQEVLAVGKTIRATDEKRMAMYRKGSSTWDGDKLHGYAAAHPEILVFNKVGQPSVIIK
jgi:hypothetical protein